MKAAKLTHPESKRAEGSVSEKSIYYIFIIRKLYYVKT